MNAFSILTNGPTAWRDARSIEDAIAHHDRAQLATRLTLALTFLVTCLRGTKYAGYISFADPDVLTGAGLLIAAAVAKYGHWSIAGHLAAAAGAVDVAPVARSTGDGVAGRDAQPPAPMGGVAADARAADPLRNDAFSQPNAGG